MNTFWLNDYTVLLNKNYVFELWPNSDYSMERKLNAITRIIIILTILGYYLTKSTNILISSFITLVILVIIFKNKSNISENFDNHISSQKKSVVKDILKNEFTMPDKKNPLMNVMMDEYKYNNKRKKAAPATEELVTSEINKKSKINKDELKLYSNLGDNLSHEHSMRNFYSMPNTTIPNKQEEFAKFCYGNTAFCKDDNCNNMSVKRNMN